MAMKKRFYTVDGQMVGYEEGGVRKDFLTDHLGSIIAIMDENEVRVFDTRYSAYGRNRWITGTGCGFGWVGSFGYRETGLFHMSHYVRARHYSYTTGNWSTVDPLWPDESAYGYVLGSPMFWIDPSGLRFFIIPRPVIIRQPIRYPQTGGGRRGGGRTGTGVAPPPIGMGGGVVNPPAVGVIPVGTTCITNHDAPVRTSDFMDLKQCDENNKRIHPKKNNLPGDGCDGAPCPRPPFCYSWVDDFLKECVERRNFQLYCDRIKPPTWVPKPEEHLKHLCLALDKLLGCAPQCYENHPNKIIIDIVKARCKGVKR